MIRKVANPARTEYIRSVFAQEDDALSNVGNNLPPEERKMQIGAEEGKILFTLARMINAKKIVEIGVLSGYSSIWIARALPEDGKLWSLEKNSQRFDQCRENFKKCGVDDKVALVEGDAHISLEKIAHEGPFDMVFIDADKKGYCKYLDWAEKNIRKGGIIVGDNTFLFGAVYDNPERDNINPEMTKIMQEFNLRLSDNKKFSAIMLPTGEGMTVAVKEF